MQGARMVAKPARKLKKRRKSMGTPFGGFVDLNYNESP